MHVMLSATLSAGTELTYIETCSPLLNCNQCNHFLPDEGSQNGRNLDKFELKLIYIYRRE